MNQRAIVRRSLRVLSRPIGRASSRRAIRRASRRISADRRRAAPVEEIGTSVSLVCSYRLADQQRLEILSTMLMRLSVDLAGTGVPVRVVDASDAAMANRAEEVWRSSGLPVTVERAPEPLAVALRRVLGELEQPHFCLQFDDMLTTDIDGDYLAGASELLSTHAGDVDVVCPFWPLDVHVDEDARAVVVTSFEVTHLDDPERATYRFRGTKPLRPVAVEMYRGRRFAIFENFTYGFFLNNLVAPASDYRRRLAWYLDRVGTTSAHDVELAAAPKLRGPWWTHVAVCLDGVALLDLDFAHTSAAVRDEIPANRVVHDAVAAGWPIVVQPRVVR